MRLAQALYNAKAYAETANMASKVIESPAVAEQARGMRAVSNMKLSKFQQAEDDFKLLLANYPNSKLKRGFIENLTIDYERNGKPAEATVLYFEQNYFADSRYRHAIFNKLMIQH